MAKQSQKTAHQRQNLTQKKVRRNQPERVVGNHAVVMVLDSERGSKKVVVFDRQFNVKLTGKFSFRIKEKNVGCFCYFYSLL